MRDTDEQAAATLTADDRPPTEGWQDRVLGITTSEALAQKPRRNSRVMAPAPPNKQPRVCRNGHPRIGNGVCYQCRDGHP